MLLNEMDQLFDILGYIFGCVILVYFVVYFENQM